MSNARQDTETCSRLTKSVTFLFRGDVYTFRAAVTDDDGNRWRVEAKAEVGKREHQPLVLRQCSPHQSKGDDILSEQGAVGPPAPAQAIY